MVLAFLSLQVYFNFIKVYILLSGLHNSNLEEVVPAKFRFSYLFISYIYNSLGIPITNDLSFLYLSDIVIILAISS